MKRTRDLGYDRDLFILPFDHRDTFEQKLFKIGGRPPTREEARQITNLKTIVYDAFKRALADGVPADSAGLLVDERYGADIARDALKNGYRVAMCAEKSGQDEFDFEYGHEFEAHIKEFEPTFVKVLVRFNPEGDQAINHQQLTRLKRLSDFCHRASNKFMFELLVPPTKAQLQKLDGGQKEFDTDLRPKLMIRAMDQIQLFGIEPDIWKLEGIETPQESRAVARQARTQGRDHVGVIILGRGESLERVRDWLEVAARTPGLIGFAVGRTLFWGALKDFKEGKLSREKAVAQIADGYSTFCELWLKSRKQAA